MNDTIKKILIILAVLGVGMAIGRFSLPAKVVEKETIVYQDRIVEKTVENKATKQNKHKTYVKFESIKPDGTKTIETRIVDNSVSKTNDNKTNDTTTETTSKTEKSKETTYSRQDTIISILADIQLGTLATPSYGLMVQKRIIGPIYINGFGMSDKTVGIGASIGF